MSYNNSGKEALAATACWTAAMRANESDHVDSLFHDPWANLLAGQVGRDWVDHISTKLGRAHEIGLVVRTKFFDDFLLRATTEHLVRQVVTVAAGMDTRGFRLAWPAQTRLFELDQPELLAHKEQLLSSVGAFPTCWRQTIGVDLRDSWSDTLCQAGFDPLQHSVWLLEGVLPYLPEPSVLHLLDVVTTLSASGSWLGFNVVNHEALTSPWARPWIEFLKKLDAPWLSTMDEPEIVLAERGWTATVVQSGEESANFGRWPYPVVPRSVLGYPRSLFAIATRMPD
ncbi:MAG TPA: SAM-dependent methyltransferase [Ktedonobacteraceae bacterium]|jgi:methyltransferase (TIGR00027 family)